MRQKELQRQPNRNPSSPTLGGGHQSAEVGLPQLAGRKGMEPSAGGGRSLRTAALLAELGGGASLGGVRRAASESALATSRMARGPALGPLSIVDSSPQKLARRAERCSKMLSFATSEVDLERQWEYERKARSVMLPRVVKAQAQERQASPPRDGRRLLDLSSAQQQPYRIASKARSEPAHGAGAMAQGATTPGARSLGHGPSMSSARHPWHSQGHLSPVAGSPSGPDSLISLSPAAAMASPATTGPAFSLLAEEDDDDEELRESPAELLWAAQLKRERLQRTPNRFQAEARRPLARGPSDGVDAEAESPGAKRSGADASPELTVEDVSPQCPPRRGGLRVEDRSQGSSPSKQSLCLRFEDAVDDGARSLGAPSDTALLLPSDGMEVSASPALTDASPMAVSGGAPPPAPSTPFPIGMPAAPDALGMSGAGWPPLRPSLERARMNFISACSSPVAEQAQGAAALPDLHLRLVRAEAAYLDGRPIAEVDGESLQAAFKHFRMPHAGEIAKEELQELVQGLGLSMASAEEVRRIADIVTPYSELDFDEFLKFIDLYFKEERDQLRTVFNKFDPDKTGELTVDSLRKLMPLVGLTPMHEMMLEALNMIGTDTHGSVDFEAFVCVLVVYRHAEGFSRPEVARLCTVFKRFAEDCANDNGRDVGGDPQLPLSEVGKALVQVFGLQVQEEANKLQSHAARLFRRRGHSAEGTDTKEIDFREFLIFARWLREVMLRRVAAEFARNTTSGSIGVDELSNVLRNLGYEPMRAVMAEILGEIEVETPGRLNLEEFFHFLLVFQGRDGFQLAELREIQEVFERFDEDGSETIDVPELGMMLRHMGYYMGLDDLHLLVKEVDVNRRGSLDHPEFRRLMRLHRDGEIRRLRTIFDRYSKGQAHLAPDDVQLALQAHLQDALGETKPELGSEPDATGAGDSAPRRILARQAAGGGVDFEAFTALAESHRSATVARQRRFAGFPRETVMQLKELFKKWDADSSGVIDPIEIEGLLKDLGMECRTREEQAALIAHLDAARRAAIEAGVEPKCRPGEGAICFWVLVQLMRILRTERDQSAEVREVQVVKELGFTKAEVEDFREVFLRWTRHGGKVGAEEGKADGTPGAGGVSFATRAGSAGGGATDQDGLSRGSFYKLLLSLGVSLGYKEKEELEERFAGADLDDEGRLSFLGFLGLMRWLLDSDFAGVNAAAQETLATSTSQGNFFQKRRQSMALFNPVGGRTM